MCSTVAFVAPEGIWNRFFIGRHEGSASFCVYSGDKITPEAGFDTSPGRARYPIILPREDPYYAVEISVTNRKKSGSLLDVR